MANITIYTTTTCPYCKMAKDYFDKNNITYKEVQVDRDTEEMQKSIDTCGSHGVPCIHIEKDDGDEVNVLGFDQGAIDDALGL